MDFLEFQKMKLETDDITAFMEGLAVVRFQAKGTSGFVEGFHNGRKVYAVHVGTIPPGTNIVRLKETEDYYDAELVVPIDSKFIMQFDGDMREQVLNILWEEHKEEVLHHMEEKFSVNVSEMVAEQVDIDADGMKEDIESLRELLSSTSKENEALRKQVAEQAETIESLKKNADSTEHTDTVPFGLMVKKIYDVKRVGKNLLQSDWFNGNFFAHVNRSMDRIVLRPHNYGNVLTSKGMMVLEGLETMSPYTGDCVLNTEYNPRDNSLTVYL